jgi:hypothetical protein
LERFIESWTIFVVLDLDSFLLPELAAFIQLVHKRSLQDIGPLASSWIMAASSSWTLGRFNDLSIMDFAVVVAPLDFELRAPLDLDLSRYIVGLLLSLQVVLSKPLLEESFCCEG